MLMLALFAFASSHPLLEALGLIHHEAAHTEAPASSHSDHELADGNSPINSNRDEIQKSFANNGFDLAAVLVLASALLQHKDREAQSVVEITGSPPPELGTTWQFSSRAALPVRAPSFAS
jgi:hypothetical protein